MSDKKYNVAIVGATGVVGQQMRNILSERKFPVDKIRYFASERSAGKKLPWKNTLIEVEDLSTSDINGIDIALFSAGGSRSKEFAPKFVSSGAVVIDNSSTFRMQSDVPLIVPEINSHAIKNHKGIIANPNCSTIAMVMALKPIYDESKIERVVVSTYQSVSGAGNKAIEELLKQTQAFLDKKELKAEVFPHPIAFECIPQIPQTDAFEKNGYTSEEMKLLTETRKILEDEHIKVTMTAVRVPVIGAHSLSVNIQTEKKIMPNKVREVLENFSGVEVLDELKNEIYPLAHTSYGKDEVFVGRIREDESIDCGLNMWIVSDNLRKGAALNAIQIAELLIRG